MKFLTLVIKVFRLVNEACHSLNIFLSLFNLGVMSLALSVLLLVSL